MLTPDGLLLPGGLEVGGSQFVIDANGNVTKINDVAMSWPAVQGAASTVLTNNGSGTLTWAAGVVADDYGYFYNLAVSATVAVGGSFPFDTDGPFTSGFLHTASAVPATSAPITIVNAGTYRVDFSVTVLEARQVALFLDGVVVPGSIYGAATGTVVTTGFAIFTATAGQLLTLRNHTSAAALTLVTPSGGSESNTTNSLAIRRMLS